MNFLGTDKEQVIYNLFRRGKSSAMDELYAEYANYLTGIGARYIGNDDDLKDVLQEAFIKIFTQMSTFEYRGKGSLKAWISRIVVNECLSFIRKNKNIFVNSNEPPDLPEEDPETEGIDSCTLTQLIRRLPHGYRVVLNLYAVEGKSHNEIAQLLNIKPNSSASQFHRAKNMLAQL